MSGRGWRGAIAPLSSMAAKLAVATVLISIVEAIGTPLRLSLNADHVATGPALWQPLTYAFVQASPIGVLFGALILWTIGGALEQQWGPRRLLWTSFGVTVLTALLTLGLAVLLPSIRYISYPGGVVMTTAVWVAYGLAFGSAQVNFWGVPVAGNIFALIGVGLVVISAAFSGWRVVVPEAIGVLLTYGAVRFKGPRLWALRFQSWRLQRQLRGRSKHLKVIARDRNTSRSSDRFLH